ncbi:MAG: RNA polymerase sigma factor [Planctomycetales bacterium]|nr:RNA polymerase sigma factor [Planctomycetales bacterium]
MGEERSRPLDGSGTGADPGHGAPRSATTTCLLIREIQGGNADAFNPLFSRFETRALEYVRSRMNRALRSVTTPRDVLQETYLRAFQAFASYRPAGDASFFDWLAAIARNQIVDQYRRYFETAKRGGGEILSLDRPAAGDTTGAGVLADLLPEKPRAGISTMLDRADRVRRIMEALDVLSEDHRSAILLCHFQGMKAEEAGKVLGRSANAVRLLLVRALRDLGSRVGAGSAT